MVWQRLVPTTFILVMLVAWICCDTTTTQKMEDFTPLTFPIDCRPFHMRSMKFLLKNFNKCSRELKANSTTDKDYEENIGCAMKCTMRATGYSTEDNLVTVESVRESVKTIRLPSALEEPVVQSLITKCHDKYGSKLNPTESQCRSYSEYAFCIQNCIADLIDSEYCIKDERKH